MRDRENERWRDAGFKVERETYIRLQYEEIACINNQKKNFLNKNIYAHITLILKDINIEQLLYE